MGPAGSYGALPQLLGPFSCTQKWQGLQKNEIQFVISTGLLSPARLQSQGHAWAPCGQERGSHIPPKPFSWHFTPVSQGAASSHQVQTLAGWETGQTCLFSLGSLGGPGMGFSLFLCPVSCTVGKGFLGKESFQRGCPWLSLHFYVPEVTEEEKTKEDKQEAKG